MVTANNLSPGMSILIGAKLYRVESAVKVTVTKGKPFIKSRIRDLANGKELEKNFKPDQEVKDVQLQDRSLEYLYPEGKGHVLLDIDNLVTLQASSSVIGEKINFLKEGTELKGAFFGDELFAIELPQFLELMITKTEGEDDQNPLSNDTKMALLETGAEVEVPSFIGVGDIIKVDTMTREYVQRV